MFTVEMKDGSELEITFFLLHGEEGMFELFVTREECIVKREEDVECIRQTSDGTYFYICR